MTTSAHATAAECDEELARLAEALEETLARTTDRDSVVVQARLIVLRARIDFWLDRRNACPAEER